MTRWYFKIYTPIHRVCGMFKHRVKKHIKKVSGFLKHRVRQHVKSLWIDFFEDCGKQIFFRTFPICVQLFFSWTQKFFDQKKFFIFFQKYFFS